MAYVDSPSSARATNNPRERTRLIASPQSSLIAGWPGRPFFIDFAETQSPSKKVPGEGAGAIEPAWSSKAAKSPSRDRSFSNCQ